MPREFREHFHSHSRPVEPLPAHEYIILLRKWGHQKTWGSLLVRSQGVHFRKYLGATTHLCLAHMQRAAETASRRAGSPARGESRAAVCAAPLRISPDPAGPPRAGLANTDSRSRTRAGRALGRDGLTYVFTGRFEPSFCPPRTFASHLRFWIAIAACKG